MKVSNLGLVLLWICLLAVQVRGYAIEGTWLAKDDARTPITIEAVTTALNGANQYSLAVAGCDSLINFAIYESFMRVVTGPNASSFAGQPCGNAQSAAVWVALSAKIFYFQIYYDELLLVDAGGASSAAFVRAKGDMRNGRQVGVFREVGSNEPVLITNQSIYLCGNRIAVDYLGNSKDSLRVDGRTLVEGGCNSSQAVGVLEKLKRVEYYRMENPNVLRLYNKDYQVVMELQFYENWNNTVPPLPQGKKMQEAKNNQSSLVEADQSKVVQANSSAPRDNITNISSTPTTPNQTSKTDAAAVKETTIKNTPATTPNSTNNESTPPTVPAQVITPNSSVNLNSSLAGNITAPKEPTRNTSTPIVNILPNISQPTTTLTPPTPTLPTISTITSPPKTNTTPQPTTPQPTTPPTTPITTPITPTTTATKPTTTTAAKPSDSLKLPAGQQLIKLTKLQTLSAWTSQSFANQTKWPARIAINGTNLVFVGCGTVSVPILIDFQTYQTKVSSNIIQAKKECIPADQPYVDLIKRSNSVSGAANDSSFFLYFLDSARNNLFTVSRPIKPNEKKDIVYLTEEIPTAQTSTPQNTTPIVPPTVPVVPSIPTSPTVPSIPTSPTVPYIPTSPTVPSPTSQPSTPSSTSTSTTPPTSNQPTQPSVGVVPEPQQPQAFVPAPSALPFIGRFNPTSISGRALPKAYNQQFVISLTLDSAFLSGTCNNYAYPYTLTADNFTTLIKFDTQNRVVSEAKADCDSSDDLLFTNIFEKAAIISVDKTPTDTILTLLSSTKEPVANLTKIVANRPATTTPTPTPTPIPTPTPTTPSTRPATTTITPTAPSTSNVASVPPATPVVSPSTQPLPSSPGITSAIQLIGRYNPTSFQGRAMPKSFYQRYVIVLTPDAAFLSGTCNNYIYPFTLTPSPKATLIKFDMQNRTMVKATSGCDQTDDALFTNFFENAVSISNSSVGADSSVTLLNGKEEPLVQLSKIKVVKG